MADVAGAPTLPSDVVAPVLADTVNSPRAPLPAEDDAQTRDVPFTTGLRISRYVLLSKLGEGGMGEVFAAYDEDLGRQIALKVVRERHTGDRSSQARIEREALALARLSHPNVLQVHDVGDYCGHVFIAMEYVRGETLRAAQARHDPATPEGRRAILELYAQAGRGLAAAHAAGLVHRDFKPENVMVGDDGRVRVLDFGLVAPTSSSADTTPPEPALAGANALSLDLTRTGSILGTPAYMAPEQFLGGAVDHRADLFSFSVALYAALYGEKPFEGSSHEDLQISVVAGLVREPPAGTAVPGWLRAVLLRALEREPTARYPSMDALLATLADDPDERRRVRRRRLGLGVAAVLVAWLVLVAGQWGWQRWQQRQLERQADDRLTTALARYAELQAADAPAEAEGVLDAFLARPENRGTAAMGRAWLARARQAGERGAVGRAIDALAAAYATATDAADQSAALAGLAAIFRDEMRWSALLLALAAEDAAGGAAPPALELAATIGRRDLRGAVARLEGPMADDPAAAARSVLAALAAATPTERHHHGYAEIADLDGDGGPELILETTARTRQLAQVVRANLRLDPVTTVDLGTGTFEALDGGPGGRGLLVANDGPPDDRFAVVSRLDGDRLVELYRWQDQQVRSALSADVDADGQPELMIGTGPYTRHLVELVPGPDAAWSTRARAQDLDARRSDIVDLLADDLDGDGRIEVVAALGPWTAYELQVLRHDPARDVLATVTRRRLGNLIGAALVRDAAGARVVVASKTDEYPSTVVFPPERPYGEPAGTYLVGLEGDALVDVGFVPAPRLAAGERVLDGPPIVGDFDGDGADEVAVCRTVRDELTEVDRDSTLLLVRPAGGAPVPVVLGELRPIAALDLDGDGDDELLVSREDDHDRVWILGSGDAALPTLQAAPPATAALPVGDPQLAGMLRHADELAQMGLTAQSAANLAQLAEFVADPRARAHVELRAAARHEEVGADARAAALYARAARELPRDAGADLGAARSLVRLGRIDAAAGALAGSAIDSSVAVTAAQLRGSRVDLDFAGPLDPSWRIAQPTALRRDGARKALHVAGLGDGELASVPVRWSGRSVALEVELDLHEVGWSAALAVGLVPEDAAPGDGSGPVVVHVTTTGGGHRRELEIGCMHTGRPNVARIPFAVGDPGEHFGRYTVRAALLPELGELTCEVTRADGEVVLYRRAPLPEPAPASDAPMRLGLVTASGQTAWSESEIRRVTVHGAALEPSRGDPGDPVRAEAHRLLVEDDPLAALAPLQRLAAPTPADQLAEAIAHARLGHLADAQRLLAAALVDVPAGEHPVALAIQLHAAPEVYAPILAGAVGPAGARTRLAEVWQGAVLSDRTPRAYAVAWTALAERDLERDPFVVLHVHAQAAAALGHDVAAEASFRAALRALADPRRTDPRTVHRPEHERSRILLELAVLALARGDVDAAARELAPLLSGRHADPSIADQIRARGDLRPLWHLVPG